MATEDRRQKAEENDKGQEMWGLGHEMRGQRTEDGRQKTEEEIHAGARL